MSLAKSVHLLGHSFGGWVAFEMARQLGEIGRPVLSLTIIDSDIPDGEAAMREYDHTDAVMAWLEVLEDSLGAPIGIDQCDVESRDHSGQRKMLHDRLIDVGLLPRRSSADIIDVLLCVFSRSLRTNYKPSEPYFGPMKLVLINDPRLSHESNMRRHESLVKGWKIWAPNMVSMHALGSHMTVLKSPHVRALAQSVQNSLICDDVHSVYRDLDRQIFVAPE